MALNANQEYLGDNPGLDERFYSPTPEELSFFLAETRIHDEVALKSHLIDVQARAYAIHPYPCIRHFAFTKLKISGLPAYQNVLKLGRERENPVFLDLGCCFGNDTRKIIADGFPMKGVLASDIQPQFWDLGHELFRSTPEMFPVPFIVGDIFDLSILAPITPYNDVPKTPMPALDTLTSLNPLRGYVSAIHTSSFFHLFDEEQQTKVARALAGLLSPVPGSVIFGSHGGLPVKGVRSRSMGRFGFFHSPESWKELWDGQIFNQGKVRVEAFLKRSDRIEPNSTPDKGVERYWLVWSVTRV